MSQNSQGRSIVAQGRIVWTLGKTMFEGKQKVNMQTKQVVIDQKTGQPVIQYGFGLAIPKIDPRTGSWTQAYTEIYQAMQAEALSIYPSGHIPKDFAFKYKDGDTDVDQSGVPYSQREGYAGHIVVACTTQLPIKFFKYEGGNNILVNDGIKCGDYVNVQINLAAHPAVGTTKAGMYVNPQAVQLIQVGKEIINTPSGDQLFGTSAPSYSGEVVADATPAMPNYAAQPQAPVAPTMPQAPVAPAMPQAPVAPHHGVLPQTMQPQAPVAPTTPQAPVAPTAPQAPMMPPMPNGYPQN